ncbi:MAG: hypothetical protein ACD_87C00305G0003 [uncultured bacterium]|nr:MAG: hypothetical protein ACD_87C00305G0003 [uncultured bacterium]
MELCQLLDHGQAEPCSFLTPVVFIVDLNEPLKDGIELVLGDADAGIFNL